MFDKTGEKTINFNEFGSLWKYVTDWQQCFRSFDNDSSGSINKTELKTAITTFGYRCVFTQPSVQSLSQDLAGLSSMYYLDEIFI